MTNATTIFWDYFRPLAEGIDGVRHVALSDGARMDRLIGSSVNTDVYPAVFALRPKYKPFDTGADQYYAVFETTFFVLCHGSLDDEAQQDAAFDEAETIALAVLHQLRQDHLNRGDVDFEYGSAELEPVTMLTLESAQGYAVKLKLALEANAVFQ